MYRHDLIALVLRIFLRMLKLDHFARLSQYAGLNSARDDVDGLALRFPAAQTFCRITHLRMIVVNSHSERPVILRVLLIDSGKAVDHFE